MQLTKIAIGFSADFFILLLPGSFALLGLQQSATFCAAALLPIA
jgi:hypothetical protein